MHRPVALVVPFLTLAACESGLSLQADVTVPADVAEGYEATAPGVLRLGLGQLVLDLEPVCGAPLADPVEIGHDFGFGCLDERESREETLVAWIEPAPAEWDAEAVCALTRETWDALDVSTFPEATRATAPDPSWPQGEGTATWTRDFSPCGGRADGIVVIE